MKLHWSPNSPFVRKVAIAIHEKDLLAEVELVRSRVGFADTPNRAVMRDNPLGKIPTLVSDTGEAIFDSTVICEYLDAIRPQPPLLPGPWVERLRNLRWQALGDGILDILLLLRIEAQRGDRADPRVLDSLATKARASMAMLEREMPALSQGPFALGAITAVCVLGYLDFRYAESQWRRAFPITAEWYEAVAERPSVAATRISDISEESRLPLFFVEGRP
jgi:glutathione S-transferase